MYTTGFVERKEFARKRKENKIASGTKKQEFSTYLQCAANPELSWCMSKDEIARFEHITNRPQCNHRYRHSLSGFILEITQELRCTFEEKNSKNALSQSVNQNNLFFKNKLN